MSDIFLSYAREDLPRVKPIVDALEQQGWSVWWDRTIEPGQTWDQVIQAAIAESRSVVVLWSRASVRSDWVQIEAHAGKRRGILIPALLDDVSDSIPLAFSLTQAANLVGWLGALPHAGFDELARAISGKLRAPTAPAVNATAAAAAVTTGAQRAERVEKVREASRTEAAHRPVVAAPEAWRNPAWIAVALGLFVVGTTIYLIQAPKGAPSKTLIQTQSPAQTTPALEEEPRKAQGGAAKAKQRQDAETKAAQLEARVSSQTKELNAARAAVTRPEPSTKGNPPPQPVEFKGPPPQQQQQTNQTPFAGEQAGETRVNSKDNLTYVSIPPGTFTMGCSPEDNCLDEEKPAHEVTITKHFWIGQTPVTQEGYQRVVGNNPSNFKGTRLPVGEVTWNEARAYCKAVGMRLPTEAEWEYAARAGSTAARYGNLDQIAWNDGKTHEVGQKQPNAFGLYDMLGNVRQWTADWFQRYGRSPTSDPSGPASGDTRVLRGGPYSSIPQLVRASFRDFVEPTYRQSDVGFRCAGELR